MIRERAPAKLNLVLHVGHPRPDGLHELCSLFASLDLCDLLTVELGSGGDQVICPGIVEPNLATRALAAFRAAAPQVELPPLAVTIEKRIPVAAGLGGGSADAASVLRAANELCGRPFDRGTLRHLGSLVGADVPSQVEPGAAIVTGAGECVEPVELAALELVLVPSQVGLSTARVYAEADRIRATRHCLDPEPLRALARAPLEQIAAGLENDLEAAALALRPELSQALRSLVQAGALAAHLTGSGPTAFGVFRTRPEAQRAARDLGGLAVRSVSAPAHS